MKYRFAFMTYEWNNEIVSKFTDGIRRYVKDHQGEVRVDFFDGFGSDDIEDAEKGVFSIFTVPHLQVYDGIILQGNRVWKPEMRQQIADQASEAGIPVVSLNYPLKHAVDISSDNVQAIHDMTAHVIEQHRRRKLAFICGLSTSLESRERRKGFLQACTEHGIDDARIYEGTWEQNSGVRAVRKMQEEGEMPEAVLCANDDTAYGAETELSRLGYRVPEDVIVTGFDNLNVAVAADVRLTTVDRDYEENAYLAMETLAGMVQGKKYTDTVHAPARLIFSESCGCGNGTAESRGVKRKYLAMNRYVKRYHRLQYALQPLLVRAEKLRDIMAAVEKYADDFKCGNLYLVLNSGYLENFDNTNPVRHYGRGAVLMASNDPAAGKCDDRHIYCRFARKDILPEELVTGKGMLEIYPLHSGETCIGYVVMDGASRMLEFNFLEILFNYIDDAIERVRRKNVMDRLNVRLSSLYVTDQLTGLYNRFGLEHYGKIRYERLMKSGRACVFTLMSVDNMKQINDAFGHETGDEALNEAAAIIRTSIFDTDDFAMRYGGDEFLIISDEPVSAVLQEKQNSYAQNSERPYTLHFSIGEYAARSYEGLTLQQAIDRADDRMYEIRKRWLDTQN